MSKLLLLSIVAMAVLIASYSWAINIKSDPALIGLWLFDDGSGKTVKDSSGNGNNGTINGDFKWDANGKFGGCIVSPGAGSIEVPKSASLDKVTKAMTIAAWFRVDSASDTGIRRQNAFLLEDQSASEPVPDGFSFRIWTTSGLSPGIYGKTKLAQKQWYHVAGTYDGTQMSLYINGVMEKELLSDANAPIDGKWSGDIGTPADPLQLKYSSETFIGAIDEVVLLNRALTEKEIKELMLGALTTTTAIDANAKLAITWARIKR